MELAELQKENESLRQSNEILFKDLQTLLQLQEKLSAENEYLKAELQKIAQKDGLDDLSESNRLLELTAQRLTNENEALKKEVAELNAKLETARIVFKEKNKAIKILQAQNTQGGISLTHFVEKELEIFQQQCNPLQKAAIYKMAMDLALSLSGSNEPAPKLENSGSLQPAVFIGDNAE